MTFLNYFELHELFSSIFEILVVITCKDLRVISKIPKLPDLVKILAYVKSNCHIDINHLVFAKLGKRQQIKFVTKIVKVTCILYLLSLCLSPSFANTSNYYNCDNQIWQFWQRTYYISEDLAEITSSGLSAQDKGSQFC